jgi:hypothetical protein
VSPGLRLVAAAGVLLVAALAVYALPEHARRRALALSVAAVALTTGLIASAIPLVDGGGLVERSVGTLVAGVPLAVRGDSTGVVIALTACAATLVTLLEPPRRALERSALLLCLAGTCIVCLSANAVLVYCGLELGNVGFLLLTVAGTSDPLTRRRAKLAFGVFHVAALGLLASALQLRVGVRTADFDAIPDGAVTAVIAVPWALAGAVRLAGAAALHASGAMRSSPAWLPVAAIPSGLAVLLRLQDSAASTGVPRAVGGMLIGLGLALSMSGALVALAQHHRAMAAGRALLVAAAGQLLVAFGTGTPGAITAAAAIGLALVAIALAFPALATPDERRGRAGAWVAALTLLGAGGIPVAGLTTGLVAASGAGVAPGSPQSLVAAVAVLAAVIAGLAGAAGAREVLRRHPTGPPARVRLDTIAAVAVSACLAAVPGVQLGQLAERVASSGGALVTFGSLAIRGPGGGWAGGYLALGLLVALAGAAAAAVLAGIPLSPGAREPAAEGQVQHGRDRWLRSLPAPLARLGAVLDGFDRWLVGQPDVPLLVIGAGAAIAWFGLRR